MSNTTIIEVRQNDGQAISHSNSEWEVNLCQPVELKRGAEVSLKGVFLNTELNNVGKIIVPDNSSDNSGVFIGFIEFMYYFFDWGTTAGFGGAGTVNERKYFPDKEYGDGFHYFLSDSPTPTGQAFELVTGTSFQNMGSTHHNFGNSDPEAFVFSFQYEAVGAPAGQLSYLYCEVNKAFMTKKGISFNNDQGTQTFTFDSTFFEPDAQYVNKYYPASANIGSFPVKCKPNTFIINLTRKFEGSGGLTPPSGDPNGEGIIGEKFFEAYGFHAFDFQKTTINANNRHFHPRKNIAFFNIKAGAYTPEKLAETLTRGITETHTTRFIDPDKNGIANNTLLTDTTTLKTLGETLDGLNPNTTPFFINETGNRVAFYDTSGTNNSYLIGTTQFAVTYQAGSGGGGKFQIDAIHTPIFSSNQQAAGEAVVRMMDYGAQALEPNNAVARFLATKSTGIGITDMGPSSFWQTQLGFDTSMFLQIVEDTEPRPQIGGGQFTNCFSFAVNNVKDGINVTGQFSGIDSIQNKAPENFDRIVSSFNFETIVGQTTPIQAAINFEDAGYANTGYYLVEVTGNVINNSLVCAGQEVRTILGIVNRYYMENAFLSATDGQGSFTYIHEGDDVTLQSVRIRILADNYKPLTPLEIQDGNAVFIQVINPIS